MSNVDLKSRVFRELESAEDSLLEEILGLIHIAATNQEVVSIPKHYEKALEKSISQINSGHTIENVAVQESIEKWLYE